jgi:hypothetical protein
MYATLATLLDRLDGAGMRETGVINWGSPVPSFGNIQESQVASVGLNPSNREFVDDFGDELEGSQRRFHTLNSLGLKSWAEADGRHMELIWESCQTYFSGNPYDRWFKRLDQVIAGTKASFYHGPAQACHLDLIPYATSCKWTDLTSRQQSSLLALAFDTLGLLLRDAPVRVLILNGQTVVDRFQELSGIRLQRQKMVDWSLPRDSKPDVVGFAYVGTTTSLSGIELSRELTVLGYNHNLQSSFGVTNEVVLGIRNWISRVLSEVNE